MRIQATIGLTLLLTLGGCAAPTPNAGPAVSIINSLSFDHAMSGKRDGLRSAWPADKLAGSTEHFPISQVKQCTPAGACSWGVLKAQRSFGKVELVPGGVRVELTVAIDVDRSQKAVSGGEQAAMTIPADVAALQARRTERRAVVLEYGKVTRIDMNYGISYELCALRLDAAREAVDKCPIEYF